MRRKALMIVLAAVLCAACHKRVYRDAHGNRVEVNSSDQSMKVTTTQGTAVFAGKAGTTLPADFPKDIPIYPGVKITGAVSSTAPGSPGYMLTMETSDTTGKVADFYRAKLSGWKRLLDMTSGAGHMLVLESPEGKESLTLIVSQSGGRTAISLTVGEKH